MKRFISTVNDTFILFIIIIILLYSDISDAQIPSYNKIAFSRLESSTDWDLWLMDINGSNQTRLHNSTSNDGEAHFRYDGNKIVFRRLTPGAPPTADIYVIDPDGNNPTNLTSDTQLECGRPKWSFDGTKIVYRAMVGPDNGDVYIMNSNGTNKTALVTGSNNDDWPSYSPDGLYIIFQRYIGAVSNQKTKIIRYKISDGTITELTDGNNLDEMPVYSPDGNYIIFKRGTTNAEIYKLRLDNLTLENLTNNSVVDEAPAYSYDGTKIAWMQATAGINTAEIWIMNSDGTSKTRLTNNSVADFSPTFSPALTIGPEINVKGNNINIVNGSTIPSLDDHTDFGSVMINGSTVTRTFTIENLGSENLILSGNPLVQILGTHFSDFTVISNPSPTILPGSNTTFQVRFAPSAIGIRTATIRIANNDADENPYTFAIQGTGISSSTAAYNKIAFTRQQSTTDWDIWIMDSDGSNQQRLLDSPDKDMNPHFSYDGNFIVFTRTSGSAPNQTNDVYIINSDGTNATNLTADISESAVGPKFSWDGNKIAFFRSYQTMGFVLAIMNKDGTNKQYIRDQNNNPVQGDSPFFTPDNQWLVFQRVNPQAQQGAIYKVPVAGGTVIQMTRASNFDELPRVSPNGLFVIFKHEPNSANKSDIARMSINQTINDSSTIVNLTNTTAQWEDSPMYSYEGDKIAFMSTTDGTYNSMEIFVMNADGTGRTRLTNNSVQDFDPTFSPAIPSLPPTPTLISPANGSTGILLSQTFNWNTSIGATAYQLQISTDSAFSTTFKDTTQTTTTYTAYGLSYNTKYYWRVRASNINGNSYWSSVWNFTTVDPTFIFQQDLEISTKDILYQNFPNPFNPSTVISYQLSVSSYVTLRIFNILGKEIATLVNEWKEAGRHNYEFRMTNYDLSSGIYFYCLHTGQYFETKKMILLR